MCVDRNPDLVFISTDQPKYGHKMGRGALARMLRKYEKLISPTKRVTFHMLRHTFATQLLKRGANLKVVQELM